MHSGPETGRHGFDARVSEADLEDTYLRAFRATLSGNGADSVMCAYNRLDGVPACANEDLLGKRLRDSWGFRGYVVSDCGAVHDIFSGHHFTATLEDAAAKAVKAGTDLTCGTEYRTLVDAVQRGLISEGEIDRSVTRLMGARIRLGLFEANDPYGDFGPAEIASEAHAKVALEAAEKSIVLLKNNGLLPLRKAPKTLAVIGPASDEPDTPAGELLRHSAAFDYSACRDSAAILKDQSAFCFGQRVCREHDRRCARHEFSRRLTGSVLR